MNYKLLFEIEKEENKKLKQELSDNYLRLNMYANFGTVLQKENRDLMDKIEELEKQIKELKEKNQEDLIKVVNYNIYV